MTEQTNADLIDKLRIFAGEMQNPRASLMRDASERLEAADQEIQRQRGINRRAERQTQAEERRSAELAAVVEKVREYVDDLEGRNTLGICTALRDILASAPADALREVKADVWDEAIAHVETFLGAKIKRAAHTDNPYRAREERA